MIYVIVGVLFIVLAVFLFVMLREIWPEILADAEVAKAELEEKAAKIKEVLDER
jgi:beta-lactam-binding protein with PASTA domain